MTSIVDALPMPMPTPVAGAPTSGAGGAPAAPPSEGMPEELTDATAPADAFAALLAAVVASVVPEPAPEPAAAPVAAVATDAPVLPVGIPVAVLPAVPGSLAAVPTAPPVDAAPVSPVLPEAPQVVDAAAAATATPVADAPTSPAVPVAAVSTETAPAEGVMAGPDVAPSAAPTPPATPEPRPVRTTDDQAPLATRPAVEVATVVTPAAGVAAPAAVDEVPVEAAAPTPPVVVSTMHANRGSAVVEPSPVPAAPAPAPLPPAQQVVTHISPLLERADGAYEISIRLHPDELGGVHVEVRLQGGEVSLQLRAETQAGHATLRESLPALRAELEAAGVTAGSLELGDWTGGQPGTHDGNDRRQAPSPTSFPLDPLTTEPDPTAAIDGDAAVDVRI